MPLQEWCATAPHVERSCVMGSILHVLVWRDAWCEFMMWMHDVNAWCEAPWTFMCDVKHVERSCVTWSISKVHVWCEAWCGCMMWMHDVHVRYECMMWMHDVYAWCEAWCEAWCSCEMWSTVFFFFFITLEPRVEWYNNLWALNTSPPRSSVWCTRTWCATPPPQP